MNIIGRLPQLNALLEKHRVPGLSIGIIRNGVTAGTVSAGVKAAGTDKPIQGDTVFEAASLTKTVFACLCTLLKIPLDTPVYELYREEGYTQSTLMERVTPRMILCHSSGLPNWSGRPVEFLFEPGAGFAYSGEGYYYLQRAVERLTGRDFPALMREMIFAPLGMNNSEAVWKERLYRLEASPHDENCAPLPLRDCTDKSGAAPEPNAAWSLYTSACDYAKFITWFLNNTELFRENMTACSRVNSALFWGLGFGIPAEDTNVLWHWGDNGGYKNLMAMDVHTKDGICIFSNGWNGNELETELMQELTESGYWNDIREFIKRQQMLDSPAQT